MSPYREIAARAAAYLDLLDRLKQTREDNDAPCPDLITEAAELMGRATREAEAEFRKRAEALATLLRVDTTKSLSQKRRIIRQIFQTNTSDANGSGKAFAAAQIMEFTPTLIEAVLDEIDDRLTPVGPLRTVWRRVNVAKWSSEQEAVLDLVRRLQDSHGPAEETP